jgi:hypothetical protein
MDDDQYRRLQDGQRAILVQLRFLTAVCCAGIVTLAVLAGLTILLG